MKSPQMHTQWMVLHTRQQTLHNRLQCMQLVRLHRLPNTWLTQAFKTLLVSTPISVWHATISGFRSFPFIVFCYKFMCPAISVVKSNSNKQVVVAHFVKEMCYIHACVRCCVKHKMSTKWIHHRTIYRVFSAICKIIKFLVREWATKRFYKRSVITGSRFFQGSRGMPSGQMPPQQQSNPCGYQNMPAAPSGKDLINC